MALAGSDLIPQLLLLLRPFNHQEREVGNNLKTDFLSKTFPLSLKDLTQSDKLFRWVFKSGSKGQLCSSPLLHMLLS